METIYHKVAVACEKDEKIFNQLKDRLYAIVLETDGMGWSYHDGMNGIYHRAYYTTCYDSFYQPKKYAPNP
ncbi:hypothetical protein [Pseudogracilibacillus sp. SO30301A]|uniref:hypothetical protein n=1 Tax=Pseudogracilibacillus sp. SO30301A TaxID=3098291 RepID=UPI00300DD82F